MEVLIEAKFALQSPSEQDPAAPLGEVVPNGPENLEACKSNAYSDHVAHRGADMMIDVPKHMFPWDLCVPTRSTSYL